MSEKVMYPVGIIHPGIFTIYTPMTYDQGLADGRETSACLLAAWMAARGFDCGEAGTVKELLDRLEPQIMSVNFP